MFYTRFLSLGQNMVYRFFSFGDLTIQKAENYMEEFSNDRKTIKVENSVGRKRGADGP